MTRNSVERNRELTVQRSAQTGRGLSFGLAEGDPSGLLSLRRLPMPTIPPPKRHPYNQWAPDARALDLVGDKWTLLIVRDLAGGPRRFVELQRVLPGISTEQLRSRLNRMVADGLLTRQRYREVPPRVDYELTERARDLLPVVGACRAGATAGRGARRARARPSTSAPSCAARPASPRRRDARQRRGRSRRGRRPRALPRAARRRRRVALRAAQRAGGRRARQRDAASLGRGLRARRLAHASSDRGRPARWPRAARRARRRRGPRAAVA